MKNGGIQYNPIRFKPLPKYHEASPQRSFRDSDSIYRSWRKSNVVAASVASHSESIKLLQQQLQRLRIYRGSSSDAVSRKYPFQIYKSPTPPDAWFETPPGNAFTAADLWRAFRVRAGFLGLTAVLGTDGYGTATHPSYDSAVSPNVDPDRAGIPAWNYGNIDFIVTDDETWYVWVDFTDIEAPTIGKSATAPTAHWPGSNYIPIAMIDCTQDAPKKSNQAVIRQLRRTDIPLGYGCIDGVTADVPL